MFITAEKVPFFQHLFRVSTIYANRSEEEHTVFRAHRDAHTDIPPTHTHKPGLIHRQTRTKKIKTHHNPTPIHKHLYPYT